MFVSRAQLGHCCQPGALGAAVAPDPPSAGHLVPLSTAELLVEKLAEMQLLRKAGICGGVLQGGDLWPFLPHSALLWLGFLGMEDARRWKEKGLCGLSFFPNLI